MDPKFKPAMVMEYNRSKIGVDLLDQLVKSYMVHRRSPRWPLALFLHYSDTALYNAYIIWLKLHPDWKENLSDKRKHFIIQRGKELVLPAIRDRDKFGLQRPIVNAISIVLGEEITGASGQTEGELEHEGREKLFQGRCYICPRLRDRKSRKKCSLCQKFVCLEHSGKKLARICINCDVPEDI